MVGNNNLHTVQLGNTSRKWKACKSGIQFGDGHMEKTSSSLLDARRGFPNAIEQDMFANLETRPGC